MIRVTLQSPFGVQCGPDGEGDLPSLKVFLILRYIKHYTHIKYLNIYKTSAQISCRFYKFSQVGSPDVKIQNTMKSTLNYQSTWEGFLRKFTNFWFFVY